MQSIIRDKRYTVSNRQAVPFTIALIGKAIRDGSTYLPIRNYAATLAAKAPRKDFWGQLLNVWNDFLKRWRYVRDPHQTETVTTDPKALFNLVIGHNGGSGQGMGVGDCDDATAAIGALLMSIGFPIRIATTAPPNAPGLHFTHVFAQAKVPGRGWITVDPVLVPHKKNLGDIADHSRLAVWNLYGQLIASKGAPLRSLKHIYQQ